MSSFSSSTSSSSLDFGAKKLLDSQTLAGVNYQKGLLSQLISSSKDRRNTLAQQYEKARANLEGLGDADRARITRDSQSRMGSVGNELANTGLYNTTVLPTLRQAVERDRLEAIADVDESVRKQYIDFDMQSIGAQDRAYGDQLGYQASVGSSVGQMLASMANNTPMKSASASFSSSFSGGGGGGSSLAGRSSYTPSSNSLLNNFQISRNGPVGGSTSAPVGAARGSAAWNKYYGR